MARSLHQAAVQALVWVAIAGTELVAAGQSAPHAISRAPDLFRLPSDVVAMPLYASRARATRPGSGARIQHVAVQYATRRLADLPIAGAPAPQAQRLHVQRIPPVDTQTAPAPLSVRPLPKVQRDEAAPPRTTQSGQLVIERLPAIDAAATPWVPVQSLPPVDRTEVQALPPVDRTEMQALPLVDRTEVQPLPPLDDLQRQALTPADNTELRAITPLEDVELYAPPREDRSAPHALPAVESPAMRAVSQRADQLIGGGISLAERRAYFAARAEFLAALSLVAQAQDVEQGTSVHSAALARALRALEEAEDFLADSSHLPADVNVARCVEAHATPVLDESNAHITPLEALQLYYTYAQQQLSVAAGEQPAASRALYALGKLQTLLENGAQTRSAREAQALVLHQAALAADPTNCDAANEVGVLLARCGQWADAKAVLTHSIALQRRPETWHNLAIVHEALGEWELSRLARAELQQYQRSQAREQQLADSNRPAVQWIAPDEFARLSRARTTE